MTLSGKGPKRVAEISMVSAAVKPHLRVIASALPHLVLLALLSVSPALAAQTPDGPVPVEEGKPRYFYEMPFEGRYIWGVTAGIIRVLYERVLG